MPYSMRKATAGECPDGKTWVTVKENADGTTTPVPGGCHATRTEAVHHLAALAANVPDARKPGA